MKLSTFVAVSVWALLLTACKQEETWDPSEHPSSPIEVPEEASEQSPAEAGRAILRLLDAGTEPREALRYDIPEGFGGRLDMELAMTMERPQPLKLPRMRLRMNLSEVERDAEGFSYRFRLEEPTLMDEEQGELPADRTEALRQDLAAAGRLQGKASLDHRGALREVSFTRREDGGGFDQLTAEIEHSVRSMTMPLPEEPVGVGARWEVSQTLTLNGLTFEQTTEMTLRERDGDKLVIDTEILQVASRQQVVNQKLPPGAVMHVNTMRGTSVGVSYVDLGSLVPHRPTTTRSTNESLMEVAHEGALHHIEVGMEIELRLSPAGE